MTQLNPVANEPVSDFSSEEDTATRLLALVHEKVDLFKENWVEKTKLSKFKLDCWGVGPEGPGLLPPPASLINMPL